MITFFIKEGDKESGPFTIDQLKSKFITKDTLVWHAALNIWTHAGSVYELKDLFESRLSLPSKNKKNWGTNFFRPHFK